MICLLLYIKKVRKYGLNGEVDNKIMTMNKN